MSKKKYLFNVITVIFFLLISLCAALPSFAAGYNTVYIGDSRTVGMYNAVYGGGNGLKVETMQDNDYWLAASSSGLNYVQSSWNKAKPNIDKESTRLVVLSGVNDLHNLSGYQNFLLSAKNDVNNVYFVSVNPTNPNKYFGAASNSAIESFNNSMKAFCESNGIKYIDTYHAIYDEVVSSSSATDGAGLHYSADVYKGLYARISSFSEGSSSGGSSGGESGGSSTVIDENTDKNAFSTDPNEVKALYQTNYGWDYNKSKIRYWTQTIDGKEEKFERLAGWQEDFLGDNIETTKLYLGLNGKSGSGSGGGGASVVKAALGEVGKDDSVESPLGSDNVKYNTWYYGHPVEAEDGKDYPWSAVFVSWCMDQADLIDTGFWKKTASVNTAYDYCTKTMGFKSYNVTATTPFGGNSYKPVAGDLIFFKDEETNKWNHMGVVVQVSGNGIYTVEGDRDDKVQKMNYTKDNPDPVKNAVIVAMEYPKSEYADGSTEENKQTVFNFLTQEMGYNSAAACGVLANIDGESGFKPTVNEYSGGGGYGLCQWTGSRRSSLVAWCNSQGLDPASIDGQLWYLKYETENSYSSVNNYMLSVPNTIEGAGDAAWYWCVHWEAPLDTYGDAAERKSLAKSTYWPAFGTN